jgi:hypothetical protein
VKWKGKKVVAYVRGTSQHSNKEDCKNPVRYLILGKVPPKYRTGILAINQPVWFITLPVQSKLQNT